MDNFTLAVIVGDAVVMVVLIAMIFIDKGSPNSPIAADPAKVAAKR